MLVFTPNRFLQKPPKPMNARLIVFFRLRLAQVGLSGRYQPEEILFEAVLSLKRALQMGKSIYNHEAWLRVTGFSYILEMRHEGNIASINIDVDEESYQLVDTLILKLQANERELLIMRFYKDMSWNEIAHIYAMRGEAISVPTLRQRGSRILKSLRKAYQEKMRLLPSDKQDV